MKEREDILLGLSFGLIGKEPGLSNRHLAKIIDREQAQDDELEAILQWEIASCTKKAPVLKVTKHRILGEYLDSEGVIVQAVEWLQNQRPKVKVIKLVAQPFLHRFKCKKLIASYGFDVKTVKTGWVPFDNRSDQWYTRGPLRTLLYAVLQVLTGRKGH